MAIKNIILDLGGVIIDIDYHKPVVAFRELSIKNLDEMYSQKDANPLFESLEVGAITNDFFVNSVQQMTNQTISTEQVYQAWNSILLNFRAETVAYILSLKEQFQLYLLSNTNAIHQASFEATFIKEFGFPIQNCFHKIYYSHQIGLRKPYANAYQFVLNDANIKARESIFIDDSPVNIPAAQALGIATHLLLPAQKLEQELPAYL